jgi:uncharacterized protein
MDVPPSDPEAAPPEPPPPVARPRPSAGRFFLVVLALFALPGSLAQSVNLPLGLAWSELAALLLPAVVAAVGWNLRPRAALLLARRPTAAQLAAAAAVAVSGMLVAIGLANLWLAALPPDLVRRFDPSQLFEHPPLQRAAIAVLAATAAPLCEEAAFRGFILSSLRTRLAPAAAITLTALLFALMHLDPVRFPPLLFLGATFGWLAWRSGSLWPSVLAHAINNGVVAAVALAETSPSGSGGETARPNLADPHAIAAFAGAMLAFAVALALYRRATPTPPPPDDALAPRDPADLDPRYTAQRVGPRLRLALAAALAVFAALASWGVLHR